MTAVADKLRFFVDESSLGLGKTLALARTDVVHSGHRLVPECPLGALDTDWIPAVAARGLVAIARDRRIRTRPGERQAVLDNGLRLILLGGKRDLPTWEWLTLVVRHWEAVERVLASGQPGPWIKRITYPGLGDVPLDQR